MCYLNGKNEINRKTKDTCYNITKKKYNIRFFVVFV